MIINYKLIINQNMKLIPKCFILSMINDELADNEYFERYRKLVIARLIHTYGQ